MIMIGLNHGNNIGAIAGIILLNIRAVTVSHHFVSLFSLKILTSFCKAERFPSPSSLIVVTCTGFSKNVSILVTAFVMASVVDITDILVYCKKN